MHPFNLIKLLFSKCCSFLKNPYLIQVQRWTWILVCHKFKNEVNDDDNRECKLDNYCENEDIWESKSTSNEIFGKVVKKPYLHYLITSQIDYKIHQTNFSINSDSQYKSIVVRNPTIFKRQYGYESRIFIAENGTILFCCN